MDDLIEDDDVILDDTEINKQRFEFPSDEVSGGAPGTFRKFRTNSYYKAISTPPKLQDSSLSSLPESSEVERSPLAPGVLYQEFKERGIFSDIEEDDEDTRNQLDGIPLSRSNRSEKRRKSFRQSWCVQDKVQRSGVLNTMNPKERKRQESMFELMASESSYLRSLNVLMDCYKTSPKLRSCMTSTDYHHLFSNVDAVRKASWRFHHALTKRRRSSGILITDVSDIVLEFFKSGVFAPYITYCSNETYQQRVLMRLMKTNPEFVRVVRHLDTDERCEGLPLHSFLLLPMQRITRIPLLIDTIRQRCDITSSQHATASEALREATKLVKECNTQARVLERTEEMIQLQKQLEFKCSRSFALVSATRYLIKRGSLSKHFEDVVFGFRRVMKQDIYFLLFNDVILATKRKSDESYSVTDYCYKERLKCRDLVDDPLSFVIIMEKTQDGQRVELKVEADKPNTKCRWMAALRPTKPFGQTVNKEAMQVQILRPVRADEPDMISLKTMDVCVVLHTTSDGWMYGERMSDGCRGWFPSTDAKGILNSKVREQNWLRRSRLLGEPTIV